LLGRELRIAASRNRRLIQAYAGRSPLRDASIPTGAMAFLPTDMDDFAAASGEGAREHARTVGWSTSEYMPPSSSPSSSAAGCRELGVVPGSRGEQLTD
jgi:hypothetical protein